MHSMQHLQGGISCKHMDGTNGITIYKLYEPPPGLFFFFFKLN